MIDEQLEFQISQYADGSLPAAERDALEARLNSDASLRDLLNEYRQLDTAFDSLAPLPAIAWDRLTSHLSKAVADADQPDEPVRIYQMPWVRRAAGVAVAACVLLCVNLAWQMRIGNPTPTIAAHGHLEVSGPVAEAPAGTVTQEISIGPSSAVALDDSDHFSDSAVVLRPQRVVIASGGEPVQDGASMPY